MIEAYDKSTGELIGVFNGDETLVKLNNANPEAKQVFQVREVEYLLEGEQAQKVNVKIQSDQSSKVYNLFSYGLFLIVFTSSLSTFILWLIGHFAPVVEVNSVKAIHENTGTRYVRQYQYRKNNLTYDAHTEVEITREEYLKEVLGEIQIDDRFTDIVPFEGGKLKTEHVKNLKDLE